MSEIGLYAQAVDELGDDVPDPRIDAIVDALSAIRVEISEHQRLLFAISADIERLTGNRESEAERVIARAFGG